MGGPIPLDKYSKVTINPTTQPILSTKSSNKTPKTNKRYQKEEEE
jgi:hypothetical protein